MNSRDNSTTAPVKVLTNPRYHQVQNAEPQGSESSLLSVENVSPAPESNAAVTQSAKSKKRHSWLRRPKWVQKFKELPWVCSVRRRWKIFVRLYNRVVADYWTYELLGMFFSVSTLVAIMGVLFAFSNKPSPHVMVGIPVSLCDH